MRGLFSLLGKFIAWLWHMLDRTRRWSLNLAMLAVLLILATFLWQRSPPALQDNTALVINPRGPIVEQWSGPSRTSALAQLRGEDRSQTRLRDVLAALEAAATDPKVPHAVLMLDELATLAPATQLEVAQALARFKASGKKLYAWGSGFDQSEYALAAQADEVWMHPMGTVFVQGYGRLRNYYKDGLDKLGVQVQVVRAGQYKNLAESYSANGPSAQTLEAEGALMTDLWKQWTDGVEKARKLPAGAIAQMIDSLPGSLQAEGGDAGKWALKHKLVDGLKTREEMRALLIERGAKDDKHKSFRQVQLGEYLARTKPKAGGPAVAVVVAQGNIVDGRAGAGTVGGESTAELVRRAREDENIKAVVLRVNSPGGSAFASELVRQELALTQKAGKPVVVSMGDLAASGGYWISLASDEMLASPATITGSIGVVGMLPVAKGAMDKLGITAAGAPGTTWLMNAYDPRKGLDPRFQALMQSTIDRTYADFLARAAEQRKRPASDIDAVAQGRVWTGAQAHARGLVDKLASYQDALASAKARAKLPADARVQYLEIQPGRLERLLMSFGLGLVVQPEWLAQLPSWAQSWLMASELAGNAAPPALAALASHDGAGTGSRSQQANTLAEDAHQLLQLLHPGKPLNAVVHCLCGAP